jgi:hypothetical protein
MNVLINARIIKIKSNYKLHRIESPLGRGKGWVTLYLNPPLPLPRGDLDPILI